MLPQRLWNEPGRRRDRPRLRWRENTQDFLCHGKQGTSALELQEMDLWVCLCSPQQGTNIILLAVSSSQVFSITLVGDLTSLLNSSTTRAFQPVQLFWPREPARLRETEPEKIRGRRGGSMPRWPAFAERGSVSVPANVYSIAAARCCSYLETHTGVCRLHGCCGKLVLWCYWKCIDSCSALSVWWMAVSRVDSWNK